MSSHLQRDPESQISNSNGNTEPASLDQLSKTSTSSLSHVPEPWVVQTIEDRYVVSMEKVADLIYGLFGRLPEIRVSCKLLREFTESSKLTSQTSVNTDSDF
jgi:hypothetical protein